MNTIGIRMFKRLALIGFLTFFSLLGCSPSEHIPYSGYVEVDKGKLYYQKLGKGEPMVVLHGGPGLDQSYLLPQMMELAKNHEVIFYDQRGSGRSVDALSNASTLNIDQFTKDLEALRAKFKLKKMILVGHSWGGLLAMNYSVTHPSKVSALILINTGPADYNGYKGFIVEFNKKTQSVINEIKPLFRYQDFEKLNTAQISDLYKKLFTTYFYDPKNIVKLTVSMNEKAAKSGFKVGEAVAKVWVNPDFSLLPQLKKLDVPTLIIHGDEDIVPVESARDIQKAIPNAHLINLSHCGHFAYIEKPEEVFPAISRFLRETSELKKENAKQSARNNAGSSSDVENQLPRYS